MAKKNKLNEGITSPFVVVISEDGEKLGNMSREEALDRAKELSLDLMQVSAGKNGSYPVCRLVDYGKMLYKKSKQDKHQQKNKTTTKEIRIGYNISDHDLATKNKKVREFINKNLRVKYVLQMKGRQRRLPKDLAVQKLKESVEELSDVAVWKPPKVSGHNISIMLMPKP